MIGCHRKWKATAALAMLAGMSVACGGSNKGPASYQDARQIVQALKSHDVAISTVLTDDGIGSFKGATSGVWIETAPQDAAAQFNGTKNAGTDTEVVVFDDHADAVAYEDIGTGLGAAHQVILGTNWAIDAPNPAAAKIRAALNVSL